MSDLKRRLSWPINVVQIIHANPLSSALQDAKAIYGKEKTATFPSEVAAKAFGYAGMNGVARLRLAAMKQYGLLGTDKKGGVLKLSKRTLTILLRPENHPEWQKEISLAALEPPLFRAFYQEKPTASDDSLKFELVANKGFTDEGAQTFLRVFRETIAYASGKGKIALPSDVKNDTINENDAESNGSECEQKRT